MLNSKEGKITPMFKVSLIDAEEGTMGICLACGFEQDGCEPDAERYKCEDCGKNKVYGMEQAILLGAVELI